MSPGKLISGKLTITSRGFGFVVRDDGQPDIFVAFEHLGTAMQGDTVDVQLTGTSSQDKPAGKIIRVLERSQKHVVGIYRKTEEGGVVYPQDGSLPAPLFIPHQEITQGVPDGQLHTGMIVVARLQEWENREQRPTGSITEIIGKQDEPGMDEKVIALAHGLSLTFPPEVEKEAQNIAAPDFKKELARRLDLRRITCFTIDPPRARDLDDALSLRQMKSGLFEVGVHISDVSYFVPPESVLDQEARKRATNVYLIRNSIPMLPEQLTHEYCSLKPKKVSLAISVLMEVNSRGEVHNVQVKESVIRSVRQFTYEEVEQILQGKKEDPLAPTLHLLELLSRVLRYRREESGSIDFDFAKPLIILDAEGIPRDILPRERLESHRLVEEYMLLANRTIASRIALLEEKKKQPFPFIYRIHPKPQREDVQALLKLLNSLGISYKISGEAKPEDFRNILELIENLEFKDFIERVALRSLAKSSYSTNNLGHFSLAFDAYTHFTSPIRRYPDLKVHRLLKRYLNMLNNPARKTAIKYAADELKQDLAELCTHANFMEQVATKAEREYRKVKSLEFLVRKVGNIYDGIISGVTSFGVFVELNHYLVEGLVPLSHLNGEHFTYKENRYQLTGNKSGKVYRLGDRVSVRIERISIQERTATFTLV